MHLLDNPTWSALTTYQARLARTEGPSRRFPPELCVHGAFAEPTPEAWSALARMATEPVGLFSLQTLQPPPGWTVTRAVELLEMVQEENAVLPVVAAAPIVELFPSEVPQMSTLYEATRPGRKLAPRLHELGGFIGIKQSGRLVAMACLRLHFPGYREISTVATLPGFEGRGYATALVAELTRRICAAGKKPYLTVRTDNQRAIAIYRRLGFRERTLLHSTTIRWEGAQSP